MVGLQFPGQTVPPPPPPCPTQEQALGLCEGILVGLDPIAVCSEPSAPSAQFPVTQPCRPPCHPDGARLECTGGSWRSPCSRAPPWRKRRPRETRELHAHLPEGEGQSGQPLTFQSQPSWCPWGRRCSSLTPTGVLGFSQPCLVHQ